MGRPSRILPSLLFIVALLHAFQPRVVAAEPSQCRRALGLVGRGGAHTLNAVGELGVAAFYPFFGIGSLAANLPGLLRPSERGWARYRLSEHLRQNWPHALAWAGLYALSHGSAVTEQAVVSATSDMERPAGEEWVVLVNGGTSEGERKFLDTTLKRRAGTDPKTLILTPSDFDDLVAQLREIRRTKGPIGRMDFHGHGYPGGVVMGDSNDPFDTRTSQPGLFAKNGRIRFFSCSTGNGAAGKSFLEGVGKTFLNQGGEVAAPQLYFRSKLTEGIMFKTGISIPDPISTPIDTVLDHTIVPGGQAFMAGFFNAWYRGRDFLGGYAFRERIRRVATPPP